MKAKQKESIEFDGETLLIAVEKDKKALIEDLLQNENFRIHKEWQSKYNSYVVYDYEPFCADGFIVNYFVTGNMYNLNFFKAVVSTTLDNLKHLEKCFKLKEAYVGRN